MFPASLPFAAALLWFATGLDHIVSFAVTLAVISCYSFAAVLFYRRLAGTMAHQIARIENEIKSRLNRYDPAASVFSRGYFEARLNQEIRRSARYELPMSVIMIATRPEVHGWTRADWEAFSAEIVTTAARLLRSEDVLGYLGGLEYAICLPHTDAKGAEIVRGRIADALDRYSPLVGLSGLSPGTTSPGDLIDAAKMDGAKRSRTARLSQTWNETDEVA